MGLNMDRYALPLGFKIPVECIDVAHELRGARIHTENAFRACIWDMEPILCTMVAWMTMWHPTPHTTHASSPVHPPLRPVLRAWMALIVPAIVSSWNVTESQIIALVDRLQTSVPGPTHMYEFEAANYMHVSPSMVAFRLKYSFRLTL